MANCNQECNKQMQGLAARLAAAEDNLANQYAGMSALVAGLSLNPTTTGVAAPFISIYNGLPSGAMILKQLRDLVPSFDAAAMKKIAMQMAAEMIDTMAAELDAAAAAMVAEATAAVDAASALVTSTTASLESAITAAANTPGALADAAVAEAKSAADAAKIMLDSANAKKLLSTGFMQGQSDIAKCKSLSMHLM